MKERPILFNAEMVNAILSGRKTQTRRAVKNVDRANCIPYSWKSLKTGKWVHGSNHVLDERSLEKCPFGKVGDRLWVKETYYLSKFFDNLKPSECYGSEVYSVSSMYGKHPDNIEKSDIGKTRPSIHMPRWACRLVLEITDVRVERLQDISEADALQESIGLVLADSWPNPMEMTKAIQKSRKEGFKLLWNSIYNNWDANPWVWVVEFKVVEGV